MSESCEETVVLPAALHARPAGALVRMTATFDATIEISYGDRAANVRGVLGVLALGAPAGSTVVVRAHGPDAAAALKAAVDTLAAAE
jgi:phosphocarrier protein HPr